MRIASTKQKIQGAPRSSAPAPEDSQADGPLPAMPITSRRPATFSESVVAGLVGYSTIGAFSDEMRRQSDQLVLVSRFKFTREEMLEAKVSTK